MCFILNTHEVIKLTSDYVIKAIFKEEELNTMAKWLKGEKWDNKG